MGSLHLPVYIFSLFVGLSIIFVCFGLNKKYQLSFLAAYLYYLISFIILGLLNLTGRYLAFQILIPQSIHTTKLVMCVFSLLAFPFVPLTIYFFINFISRLLNQEISSFFNRIFSILWVLLFICLLFAMSHFYRTNDDYVLETFYGILHTIAILSLISSVVFMFTKLNKVSHKKKREDLKKFAVVYLLSFITLGISDYVYFGEYTAFIEVFVYFSINFPPLLIFSWYLNKYYVDYLSLDQESDILDLFFSKYHITPREQDIMKLILEGKSNIEIGKDLYISTHSVRNHIYNIYQKLGVKNRVQITNLIRSMSQKNKDVDSN